MEFGNNDPPQLSQHLRYDSITQQANAFQLWRRGYAGAPGRLKPILIEPVIAHRQIEQTLSSLTPKEGWTTF